MLVLTKKTKTYFIRFLNEMGCPDYDKKSKGGRIPDWANYGRWLKNNDPSFFEARYHQWKYESR